MNSNTAFEHISPIPVRTWRGARVNDASLSLEGYEDLSAHSPAEEAITAAAGISVTSLSKEFALPELGAAQSAIASSVLEYMEHNANRAWLVTLEAGQTAQEPLVFDYNLTSQAPALADNIVIHAGRGSSVTVVIRYRSECNPGEAGGFHSGLTRIYAEEGARVKLVKVQTLSENDRHADHVAAMVQKEAEVSVVLAELGGAQGVGNCNLHLAGEGAVGKLDTIYLGDGSRRLDLNYRIAFSGARAFGNIRTHGILHHTSRKIYRGTLDFLRGAKGAKGREEEYTTLLSPDVRNISVPLLLCGEDDVEGAHATSTGSLSERQVFYLMSRGLSEGQVKRILVEASFAPVLDRMGEALAEEIRLLVSKRLEE